MLAGEYGNFQKKKLVISFNFELSMIRQNKVIEICSIWMEIIDNGISPVRRVQDFIGYPFYNTEPYWRSSS